ncbi:MAG: DUF4258 domain-containing protein, partial [Candidatus Heimdallarchaeaceae archaeon]
MYIHYYIDPKKGLPHIYNHNVSESEVEDVLLRPGEDHHGREGSRIALGQTRAGRYLRVIYIPDAEQESVFIITAFELTGKPLVAY